MISTRSNKRFLTVLGSRPKSGTLGTLQVQIALGEDFNSQLRL
jgi:hypothetical protein